MRALRATLVAALVIALLAIAGSVALIVHWLNRPLPLAADRVELSIDFGSSPRQIADGWVRAGVQASPRLLYAWFRWSGQAKQIRAGAYEIAAGTTPRTLLAKMVRGDETLASVRLIEGWTFRQIRAELARAPDLVAGARGLDDAQLMRAIGLPGVSPEGRFHPDTYAYAKGSTDVALLQRAARAMQQRLADAWRERDGATPLRSADEALTLASIVEKETGIDADRGRVAGVFVNRLRLGMPLQTDPTVIYGLGAAFDGNLRKRDLQADTPYNTYLRTGLPPTPIAAPGRAALLAAVRPEPTKALYFVARGDGSSEFSETLAEHTRAVVRYQKKPKGPS